MDLSSGEGDARTVLVASLEPTAKGDPLLTRFGAEVPAMTHQGVPLHSTTAEKCFV